VVEILADVGFAPVADNRQSVVRLTRCPLLEAAHRFPDVVCGVHLGLVRGALEEYGAEAERSELFAFSEPGACRLELMTRPTKVVP
jgi:predicted ArsR family transcriptional regulator